jgi:hypothetical protein
VRFKGGGAKKDLGRKDFWRVLCRDVRKKFSDSTSKT